MRGGPLSLLCIVALAGCSYDWSVPGAGPLDASSEGGPSDAPAASTDADGDTVAADAAGDATTDAPADSPPSDCKSLETQVRQARAAAVACQSGTSACMTTVQDECGCTVVVGAQDTATQQYVSAIAQLKASCTLACQGCGATPQKGLCVVSDAGGSSLACYQ